MRITPRRRANRTALSEPGAGPADRRRDFARFFHRGFLALFCGAWLAANAAPPPPGVAPVTTPSGGFAIDGDLLANTLQTNAGDWIFQSSNPGPGSGVLSNNASGTALNPLTTFHFTDPFNDNTTDRSFTGGHKWFDDPRTWEWTVGKPSAKTDINNALLHIGVDTNGHIWVMVAADRYSTSGDSYIDFEFLQNTLVRNTTNSFFSSAGPNGGRTTNDVLVSVAFTSGGSIADCFLLRWTGSGGNFSYVDQTASLLASGRVFVALNSNSAAVPFGAFGLTSYAPRAFVEAAVDMTALVGGFDPCISVGFKTIMIKTKSSSSTTATIEDFVDPIQYNLNIGPSANAGPDQTRCSEGASTSFALNGAASSGLGSIARTTWSVVSGSATIDNTNALATIARVSAGAATLRLTVVQSNACTETDDVVLNVLPLPVCSIGGAASVCPGSTNQFIAPAGMASYAWKISGSGAIVGAVNQRAVVIAGGVNCGESFTLTLNVTSNQCSASCVSQIFLADANPPSLTVPGDRTLECPADTRTNATGQATATDDCGFVTVNYSDVTNQLCGGSFLIARTWTATDRCGNADSRVQNILVRDTTAPVLVCPPNRTLDCPADTAPKNTGVATATDTCSPFTISSSDVLSNSCGGTFTIWRTWTATDACSNATSCVQIITVRDTNAPVLTCPPNVTLECPADTTTNNTGAATATDTCSSLRISLADTITNQCGNSYVIARRWFATDDCKNVASCTQLITVRDTTPPVLVCPANVTLQCPADTRTNVTGAATATDTCGLVTITFSDVTNNRCGNTKIITRTWVATDQCTNRSTCLQVIRVVDTTPPVISCPSNKTVECGAAWAFDSPTTSDTCGASSIALLDTVTNAACGNTFTAVRTWRATDACGNVADCSQTVTVVDTTPPVITCPALKTIECPNPVVLDVPTATDICGKPRVELLFATTNVICGATVQIEAHWRATDPCGNFSDCNSITRLVDTTAPVITCVGNKTVECGAAWNFDLPAVTDTCGVTTLIIEQTKTNATCGNTFTATRHWLATDSCSNVARCSQTVTVVDTTPPVITCAGARTVQCGDAWAFDFPTATDVCGTNSIAVLGTVTNAGCGSTFTATRTWRATDACGNHADCSQTVTVVDTRAPLLTCVANKTIQCGTAWTFDQPTATDVCGTYLITIVGTVTNPTCGNTFSATRTWRAADGCSNAATCSQTVTVIDTTPPVITCPASLTLECPSVTTTNATGVATATDNCGLFTITFSDSVSSGCGNSFVISRTWRAADPCGNASTCVQTITVRDTTLPNLSCPTSATVECGASTLPSATGAASATDNCGTPTVTYADAIAPLCGSTRIITRTWTATDPCSNKVSCVQTITVRDTTPPALRMPTDRVIECPGDTRTNATGVATATDVCGGVTISYTETITNGCGATRTIQRLWTATDECGNSTNGLQTIRVVDTLRPTFNCPSLAVQCEDDVPPPYANLTAFLAAGGTASDACDASLTFSLISAGGLVGRCPGTVTRVYRVTDDCGNFTDCTQTIVVDDTIAPSLTCPASAEIECSGSLDPALTGRATATDNCSTNVAISYSDAPVDSSYSVNFYAADPNATPSYLPLGPASLPCPSSGRAQDPLRNAACFGPGGSIIALNTMSSVDLWFGQIVPFEAVVSMSGAPGPENGRIEFTCDWSTFTTSNRRFGYDTNYMVYCAFVDTGDLGTIDPHTNAHVESVTSTIVNRGTIDERIRGTIRVAGLDPGDRVVVEIWMVLDSSAPDGANGTISAGQVSAYKVLTPPVPVSTGGNSVSINAHKVDPLPVPQTQPPLPPLPPQPPYTPRNIVGAIDRTWTGKDDCGNQGHCIQRITIRDSKPPVIQSISDLVLECPAVTTTNAVGVPLIQDACGGMLTFSYSDIVSNSCGGTKTVFRTWTATDEYDNTTKMVQTILVRDTTPPAIAIPPDAVMEAPGDLSTNRNGSATAADACGNVTITYTDSVTNGCASSQIVFRRWTVTDACGNSTNQVQTLTVRDTTPPAIAIPPDAVMECPADLSTNRNGTATAANAVITFTDTVSTGCGGSQVVTRRWTATDACGNSTNGVQTLTVFDYAPPILRRPADTILECPPDLSTNRNGTATAVDPCGAVTLTYNDSYTNSCGGSQTIGRRWTATDACGNSVSQVQIITVRDTTPPVLNVGTNRTIVAGTPLIFDPATASDACGSATVGVFGTVTNSLVGGTYAVTRTWQATDECGNAATNRQTITVLPPPQLSLVSAQARVLTLRWPAAATDYRLESSVDLKKWSPFSGPHVLSNIWCYVQIPMTGPRQFFRLANAPPPLQAQLTAPGKLTLVWPVAPTGFRLEASDNLRPPNWTSVPGTPTVSNQLNYLEINLTGPKKFYRLNKPPP